MADSVSARENPHGSAESVQSAESKLVFVQSFLTCFKSLPAYLKHYRPFRFTPQNPWFLARTDIKKLLAKAHPKRLSIWALIWATAPLLSATYAGAQSTQAPPARSGAMLD